MLAKTLSNQEALAVDTQVNKLSDCKYLSEEEVVELAAKCKVQMLLCCAAPCFYEGSTPGWSQCRSFYNTRRT